MIQLELGTEMEQRVLEAARSQGVSVDDYVRLSIQPVLPRSSAPSSLQERREAIAAIKTLARDHGITLPPGVTVTDLIHEGRR